MYKSTLCNTKRDAHGTPNTIYKHTKRATAFSSGVEEVRLKYTRNVDIGYGRKIYISNNFWANAANVVFISEDSPPA